MTSSEKRLNNLDGKSWVKATKSWFVINPKSRTSSQIQHPAKFPEELVKRFLKFFTKVGSWILDPFAGVGSTLIASKEMGRNSVGVELSSEFVDIGETALYEGDGGSEYHLLQGDSRKIVEILNNHFEFNPPSFDFVMTSPPYWDMLRKSRGGNDSVHKERAEKGLRLAYSDKANDIGNITDYPAYIESIGRIIGGLRPLLSDRAYLVVVVQNMRDVDGSLKTLAWDLAKRLADEYHLCQEMIWCQDNKKLGCWGYPTTYVSNVHHHYCLILQNLL
ncbi:MAG: DNA methyltransferase [Candidatus Thorarchaeota archaeon]